MDAARQASVLTPPAIEAFELTKRYGKVLAVDALSLEIPSGQFFGLLGPNGSGKTTTVHMLSTLIRPTRGSARIAGFDVLSRAIEVRRTIGVVFQDPALDQNLSVAENLRFAGQLYGLSKVEIRRRSEELMELFGLTERRNQPVSHLSGGLRRALDIARGVIHEPRVLFLDEPTIGLDVPNRRRIWRFIGQLRARKGMTVLLTTHYLEEAADCDVVAFIQQGRIVKSGHPHQLIESLGSHVIEIEGERLDALAALLAPRLGAYLLEGETLCFRFKGDAAALAALQAELAPRVAALRVRRPNLNDVFLWINEARAWQAPEREAHRPLGERACP
ncbi:MAG: ABC transporter ATP-binding protein [Azospira oryzae]|nr:MAG: ABC transporter ATP-binding protein [Azospira oryzae]PZP82732.1 MAG: ABC transporter ATP-binding protein [Azospira oryzae]